MALIVTNRDGTLATKCALCEKPLTRPIFSTSHFIGDRAHEFWKYSDAAMHWTCYASWEHQQRFAAFYFAARLGVASDNPYWKLLWQSDLAFVTYGVAVNEVSVVLKKSGTDLRINREAWPEWLGGKFRKDCSHPLEISAVEEISSDLRSITLPEASSRA